MSGGKISERKSLKRCKATASGRLQGAWVSPGVSGGGQCLCHHGWCQATTMAGGCTAMASACASVDSACASVTGVNATMVLPRSWQGAGGCCRHP